MCPPGLARRGNGRSQVWEVITDPSDEAFLPTRRVVQLSPTYSWEKRGREMASAARRERRRRFIRIVFLQRV